VKFFNRVAQVCNFFLIGFDQKKKFLGFLDLVLPPVN